MKLKKIWLDRMETFDQGTFSKSALSTLKSATNQSSATNSASNQSSYDLHWITFTCTPLFQASKSHQRLFVFFFQSKILVRSSMAK
jgi:hypothetical protein